MTAPTAPRPAHAAVEQRDTRPAYAAYRQHVLYECRYLRDEQCQTCRDLARDASAESWQRSERRAPVAREA